MDEFDEGPRIWLDVPYRQRQAARRAGALFDREHERYYAPRPGMDALASWSARPDLPAILPGEDRAYGQRESLYVDLVPASCWFTNARSAISERDWDRVHRMVVTRAGRVCEACGAGRDPKARRWLEAHERWRFDEITRTQRLTRLICLCTNCHEATHFGLAQVRGRDQAAFAHLLEVTGMDEKTANVHLRRAFAIWEARSRTAWALDLSVLTDADIALNPPPAPVDRRSEARRKVSAIRSREVGADPRKR
jgi:hypothetical protein